MKYLLQKYWAGWILACVILSSCGLENPFGGLRSPKAAKPSKKAMSTPGFFIVEKGHPLFLSGSRFGIYKSALNREFLLRTEIIAQMEVPMFQGLKSRVVKFERQGHSLYLMEALEGRTVSKDVDQKLILTSFPIVDESKNGLIFDFSKGMSQIFQMTDWSTSDFPAKETHYTAAKVKRSFVKRAHLGLANELIVEQVAQVEAGDQLLPLKLKYYFRPYQPDESYKPFINVGFDRVGYFEVAALLNPKGGLNTYASRFHPDQPIVFALSANTPPAYVAALTEGILYWNKGFGSAKIQVIQAPSGISAPNPDYNIVQWVDWDMAGFAYADAQMDPRTGQILNAQIFLTSAFAKWSDFRKRWFLQKQKEAKHSHKSDKSQKLWNLASFGSSQLCQLDLSQQMAQFGIHKFLAESTDPSAELWLKLSRDFLREVVAHEVGHTLGFRHNFAGSIASNEALKHRESHLKAYFRGEKITKDLIISSSVMDYLPLEEVPLVGAQIAAKDVPIFSYDQTVVNHLYKGKSLNWRETPLFCTDSHLLTEKFADCRVFDMGKSIVDFSIWNQIEKLNSVKLSLLSAYAVAKNPPLGSPALGVEHVIFNPGQTAERILDGNYDIIRLMSNYGHLISTHRKFPAVSTINQKEVKTLALETLQRQLDAAGGFKALFPEIADNFATIEYQKFLTLLEESIDSDKTTFSDTPLNFTAQELTHIKATTKAFYRVLQARLLAIYINQWSLKNRLFGPPPQQSKKPPKSQQKLEDHEVNQRFADFLYLRSEQIIFDTKTATQIGLFARFWATSTLEPVYNARLFSSQNLWDPPVTKTALGPNSSWLNEAILEEEPREVTEEALPVFKYGQAFRHAASQLLAADRSAEPGWGLHYRFALDQQLNRVIKSVFSGKAMKDLNPRDYKRPVARWIIENKKVQSNLQSSF